MVSHLRLKNCLLKGEMDEQIVFQEIAESSGAVWSLLTATGYLKVISRINLEEYELALTNHEVWRMFDDLGLNTVDIKFNISFGSSGR